MEAAQVPAVTENTREVTLFSRIGEILAGTEKALSVATPTTDWLEKASAMDGAIGATIKRIEDARLAVSQPLGDAKKANDALFGAPRKQVEARRKELKAMIVAMSDVMAAEVEKEAQAAQKEAEDLALEQAEQHAEAGDHVEADQIMEDAGAMSHGAAAPTGPIRSDMGSRTSIVDHWKHEVVDPTQVPSKFLKVDDEALAAYAKAHKDAAKVSGVRFYNDKIVRTV